MIVGEEARTETQAAGTDNEILRIEGLVKYFPIRAGLFKRTVGHVHAVDGVNLSLKPGETLGVVGESGCGKTTLGRTVVKLIEATEGRIVFDGRDITKLSRSDMRPIRREMMMIFQDPYASLNARKRVGAALTEVGLDPECQDRYPHEFSGGQRQRIAIARAMVLEPKFVLLDEPTSALDMSVQAQIVDLLRDLQKRHDLAYLFISHDLKVVRALSNYVVVLKNGKVVEEGTSDAVFANPQHAYTKALLAAAFDLKVEQRAAVAT